MSTMNVKHPHLPEGMPPKYLQWAIVFVLFWAAWIMYRFSTALDIQDQIQYWVGVPLTWILPAFSGFLFAKWCTFHHTYRITREPDEVPEAPDQS